MSLETSRQIVETRNSLTGKEDYSHFRLIKEKQYSENPSCKRKAFSDIKKPELSLEIRTIRYSAEGFTETRVPNFKDIFDFKPEKNSTLWINIEGLKTNTKSDVENFKQIEEEFQIHPLLVEDIKEQSDRPRMDIHKDQIFFMTKMIYFSQDARNKSFLEDESISIVVNNGSVICFQEGKDGDVLEPVRQELRSKSNPKLMNSNENYLFYILLDTIVYSYGTTLKTIVEELEQLEKSIVYQELKETPTLKLYNKKRQLSQMRKVVKPMTDALVRFLAEEEGSRVVLEIEFELNDVKEKLYQVQEDLDAYLDLCTNLLDLYISILDNKSNEIMKFLTIMSSFFIPLTFITGVYGMNFSNMPELRWEPGYFVILAVMLSLIYFTWLFFRRRGWV